MRYICRAWTPSALRGVASYSQSVNDSMHRFQTSTNHRYSRRYDGSEYTCDDRRNQLLA